MQTGKALLYLVIPCYHESKRLPPFLHALGDALDDYSQQVIVQVADDGSNELERQATHEIVENVRGKRPELVAPMLAFKHAGKGGTLLNAWKVAPQGVTHYAFADADGAVSPAEIRRVLEDVLSRGIEENRCYFAVRQNTKKTKVKRHPVRRLLGFFYYRLVNFILDTRVNDPACGFKILSRQFYETCGHLLTEQEWALDIEILARIYHHGFALEQIPVSWEEKGGSKIVRNDILPILRQIIRIKQRSHSWEHAS